MYAPTTSTRTAPRHSQRAYTAYGASARLWASRVPEIVISGPAGTGKSRACLEKLHWCALKYHGMRGLIIRKTRESLSEAALVTFEEKVLPEFSPMKDGPRRNFRQVYRYPTTSEIVVGGLDKPGKIMSTEYDLIYVQEATELDLDDWQALTTRLRNNVMPYQQLLADCNPDAPTHWLWLRSLAETTLMLHSRHEENPRLWRNGDWTAEGRDYLATLDRLTGVDRARFRFGQWVQASGLVYDVWSDSENVTEAADHIPDGGDLLWGVDDGYAGQRDVATGLYSAESHPRVIGLYQIRPDGTICRFAETYAVKTLSERQIADTLALGYPLPDYAVVDSSAAELRGRLQDADIPAFGGTHGVEEGIKELRRRIAPDAQGRRLFLVHPRCVQFRAEMASYRRDPSTGKPIKQFDHGPDEARMIAWKLRYD